MIPAEFLQDRRNLDNLLQYLSSELWRVRGERQPLEERWGRIQALYRAEPETPEKTFPWKGAANLVIPVVATDVDTTVAGLMGALWANKNLWATEALRPDWIDFSARLQECLGWAQDAELSMYDVTAEWLLEMTKLGTGILKWRYRRETKLMYEWRETANGTLAQMVRRMAYNRPEVRRVALADFYIPGSATDIEEAPWCAERVTLNWQQLESRVRQGIYLPETLDRIGYYWRQTQPRTEFQQYLNIQEQLDNFVPGFGDRFEFFEFWTNYDIMRRGEPQSLLCTVHVPTMTYARVDFNPFFNQEKPYAAARFIRQEGRFYGLGLGHILDPFQEEISAMHCQRLDSGTVKNASVFKGKRGTGVKADEAIWPGRVILMDDPINDLVPMNMGAGLTGSTIGDEEFTLQYARQRSSISDYQRGGAGNPAISYSAATTTVEMLRQGKLRLDQVLREAQSALGKVGRGVTELYQQFDQQGKFYMVMGDKDGAQLQQVLTFPLDMVRSGVAIRVTATSAQLSKEAQVRTNQIVFSMVMQFYQQMMQAMGVAFNPQIPPPMQQMAMAWINGGMVLARRILDEYDIQDVDRIIPDFGAPSGQPTQNPGQPTLNGGPPVAPGFAQPQGFPAVDPRVPGALGAGPSGTYNIGGFGGGLAGTGGLQQRY